MKDKDLYSISFKGLSLGNHSFDWTLDKEFFALYEMSDISDSYIEAQLNLMKHSGFLELIFVLKGWVEVVCDRCLDPLKLDMKSEAQMYVKFGEQQGDYDTEEDDDDVIFLSYGDDKLNVAQYLYEYAHLSLPMRKVHPLDVNGQTTCNVQMISKLEEYLVK